ncbi:unnamed protein product [Durusdinium trenchii]|uniref:K Homology domain-containing protein n=1 Tax=Durusdinium trenchii TaxID=1381693 RepID=A0ABP0N412_9DINO
MAESRITIVNPDCAVCCQHSYANDHLAHQGKNEQPLLTLMVLLLAVLLGAKMIRASSVFSHKHRGGSVFFSFSQTPTATGPRRGRTCRFSSTLTDLPSSDGISGRSSSPKARKESKLAEPPDWLPKSPDEKPKPVEAPRAPKSNPAPVPGEGRAAAPLQQQPAKAAGDVPDWLQDLFGGSNAPSNVAGPLLRPRVPHREVMVPQQCVARLIGKGGEVIMGICNQTGADVKIRQETKELGYSLAIITGHPDAMDAAERLVRQKLGLSGTGFASKELTVQSEHVPTIMGAKGGNLARIRQQAGNLAIELRPPDLPGMAHTAILGPGSQEQLMVAEQLIMATLAEAAVATAISNR